MNYELYETPISEIERVLPLIRVPDRILEPSAGSGNFCRVIKERYPKTHITAVEIQSQFEDSLRACGDVYIGDYLSITLPKFDLIIGNPPYSLASQFVEKSLSLLNPGGQLIFLLKLSFLESKSRYSFWQKHPVTKLWVLSSRPKFINNKTDNAAYAWFIWSTGEQEIKVL